MKRDVCKGNYKMDSTINSTTTLPHFNYNPNAYEDKNYFSTEENICKCCGKKTSLWTQWMYSAHDIDCICVHCIADGSAAKKFDGDFIDYAEPGVSDPTKNDELMHRTPGYDSWQGEHWLTCCDDYCAFIGHVGCKELNKLNIPDDVIKECEEKNGFEIRREDISKNGSLVGYLFQCLHCKKYHLWVDFD